MAIKRMASVYATKSDFFVEPNNRTINGLWLNADPVGKVGLNATDAELGVAIRTALEASQVHVPHPTDWRKFPSSLLRVAGVRSWNALQRTAAKCETVASDATIKVVPYLNGGDRGPDRGYQSIEESVFDVPVESTVEELGAAARLGIQKCR